MQERERERGGTVARWAGRLLGLGVLATACYLGALSATCAYHARLARSDAEPTTQAVLRDTPAVVSAVRDLAVLESASFHMERVIDLRDRSTHLFGLVEIEDALLLVAAVDVVAGIDLGQLRDGDVRCDPAQRTAELTLPPPVVLSSRLDNDRTYVHTRTTDALMPPGLTLETRARKQAEQSLREAAVEAGILGRARENATRTIEALVRSFGFERVSVRFRAE